MKKLLLAAASVFLLSACDDGSPSALVTAPDPQPIQSNSVEAITAAAFTSAPISTASGIDIGVLDRDATPTSRLVSFENDAEYRIHRYTQRAGTWTRGEEVARGPRTRLAPARAATAQADVYGYSGRIARIVSNSKNQTYSDEWFISGLKEAGTHSYIEYYGEALQMDAGQFYPGDVTVNDTVYSVALESWSPFRVSAPAYTWPTAGNVYSINTTVYNQTTARYETRYPEYWRATYRLSKRVIQAIEVSLWSNEGNEACHYYIMAGPAAWTTGVTYTYQWDESLDGVIWNLNVKTTQQYYPIRAWYGAEPDMYRRVTIRGSDGSSGSKTILWTHHSCDM